MGRNLCIVVLLCACGEPILKNAPKPDPGAVAGVAAAAAAAATLASPDTAARRQEQLQKDEPDNRGVKVKETVPADVLDRLDRTPQDAGVSATSTSAANAPATNTNKPATNAPAKTSPAANTPAPNAPAGTPARKARPPVIPPPSAYTPKS